MVLDSLYVGMELKNYNLLCEEIQEPSKKGRAKANQMKWLEEYVRYSRRGHKFVIEEIMSTDVQPMGDKRSEGNNSIAYVNILEKLVLDLMLQEGQGEKILLSKTQMFQQLNMVSQNYGVAISNQVKFADLMNVQHETTSDWFDRTDAMLEGNLVRTLKNLASQSLVFWNKVIVVDRMVVTDGELIQSKQGSDDYEVDIEYKRVHRRATPGEERAILRIEREVMDFLGCRDKQVTILKGLWSEFTAKVTVLLDEIGINYYYQSYEVVFNQDHAKARADELSSFILSELEKDSKQAELNTEIQARIQDNVTSRHKGVSVKFGNGKDFRGFDAYLADSDKINNTLINPNAKDIRGDIQKQAIKENS